MKRLSRDQLRYPGQLRKLLIISTLIVLVLISESFASENVWTHPYHGKDKFNIDVAECNIYANDKMLEILKINPYAVGAVESVKKQYFRDCMYSKGWTLKEKSDSASVAGEEAWILWAKNGQTDYSLTETKESWNIIKAFPNYKECLKGKIDHWNHAKNLFIEIQKNSQTDEDAATITIKEVPNESILLTFEHKQMGIAFMSSAFYCLPDRIDPRKQKEVRQ